MPVGTHFLPGAPLTPGGALSHFAVNSYLKTQPGALVAVPPELPAGVPRTFQLYGNCLERRGVEEAALGAQGGGDRWCGDGRGGKIRQKCPPVHGHFTVCTSDGWRVCPGPSPPPREIISRVLFSLAGSNFWLTPFAP